MKVLKCAAGLLAATALGFGIYRLESRRPLTELERAGISVVADDDGIIQSVAFQHVDESETYLNYVARLKSVNSVFLCNRHVTRDGLAALAALPRLRRLDLSNSHADAGSLAAVGRIGSLQFLNLAHCSWVSDNELAQLLPSPRLESLQLEDCPITDAGLAHLRRLSSLRSRLQDLPITDHGLEELAALTELTSLSVYQCAVTGEGVVAFRDRALESLAIHSSTALTSAGLRQIGGVSALRSLRIHGPLPADGWDGIADLPHLDYLSLLGGELTGDVAEALTRSRSLVRLRLQDSEVRDESFRASTALSPGFRLELANCRFSREMLRQLSEARPDLSVSEDFFQPRMMMPR